MPNYVPSYVSSHVPRYERSYVPSCVLRCLAWCGVCVYVCVGRVMCWRHVPRIFPCPNANDDCEMKTAHNLGWSLFSGILPAMGRFFIDLFEAKQNSSDDCSTRFHAPPLAEAAQPAQPAQPAHVHPSQEVCSCPASQACLARPAVDKYYVFGGGTYYISRCKCYNVQGYYKSPGTVH